MKKTLTELASVRDEESTSCGVRLSAVFVASPEKTAKSENYSDTHIQI